jgi:hypothetical protein
VQEPFEQLSDDVQAALDSDAVEVGRFLSS